MASSAVEAATAYMNDIEGKNKTFNMVYEQFSESFDVHRSVGQDDIKNIVEARLQVDKDKYLATMIQDLLLVGDESTTMSINHGLTRHNAFAKRIAFYRRCEDSEKYDLVVASGQQTRYFSMTKCVAALLGAIAIGLMAGLIPYNASDIKVLEAVEIGCIACLAILAVSGTKAACDYTGSIKDVTEGYLYLELQRMGVLELDGDNLIFLPKVGSTSRGEVLVRSPAGPTNGREGPTNGREAAKEGEVQSAV